MPSHQTHKLGIQPHNLSILETLEIIIQAFHVLHRMFSKDYNVQKIQTLMRTSP